MKEVFKDIEGFQNYQISNFGNVFSKNRNRLMTPQLTKFGYMRIQLWKNQIQKKFMVHRLVAEAFIPNPENKSTVNHIDSNRSNNMVNNLEWATLQENSIHGFVYGKHKPLSRENHPRAKKIINTKTKEITYTNDAAIMLNISSRHLSNMLRGHRKNKTEFKYYEE